MTLKYIGATLSACINPSVGYSKTGSNDVTPIGNDTVIQKTDIIINTKAHFASFNWKSLKYDVLNRNFAFFFYFSSDDNWHNWG